MASFLNQMQTWLMLPKLWRLVGFASALLGLLCFALSSSFNSLFGEWNHLKTFLYVIFCFIICIAVLFANVWQHSSSLRLEAHSAFLVLNITSFYTFFFDQAAKGKPDAYSLVSSASFAVMSLSLSLQTHLGFEVDLLYFFLGALIVQLMKIKWLFGIAGAVFSYFFVILRSCLDVSPEAEEDTYTELQDQPHVVIEVDSLQLASDASSASALLVTPEEGNAQEHAMAEVEVDSHAEEVSDVVPLLATSQESNTEDHAMAEVDSHSQEVSVDVALNEVGSQQLQSDAYNAGALVVTPQEANTHRDRAITEEDSHSQEVISVDVAVNEVGSLQLKPAASSVGAPVAQDQAIDSHSQDVEATELQLLDPIDALWNQSEKLIALLDIHSQVEPFQPYDNLLVDALPSAILNDLNMLAYGLEKESRRRHINCCREFLRWFLSTLQFEDLNNEENGVDDKVDRISGWIKAFDIAVHLLFPNERRLCDLVFHFHGFHSILSDRSFAMVCQKITVSLLDFANSFAVVTRSPKIFSAAVDVFTKLSEVIPVLKSLFPHELGVSLGDKAIMVWGKLGRAIRDSTEKLPYGIYEDNIVAVPGGIYSSTCDVMRCIRKATEANFIIEQSYKVDPEDSNGVWLGRSLSAEIGEMMAGLEGLVEHNSSNCMEPALSYVTMMNNTMYIQQEVLSLMTEFPSGDGEVNHSTSFDHIFGLQIQKQTEKFCQSLEGYLRSSWNWVLGLVKVDSNDDESVVPDVAAESMKGKLQSFNTRFFEIWYFQSKWFATDGVREILIQSMKNMLLPAYGNFIGRFQHILGEHDNASIHHRMSESDIEAQLNQLFLGGYSMNQ